MSFMDFELTEEELAEIRHMDSITSISLTRPPVPPRTHMVQHKSFVMDLTEQELQEIERIESNISGTVEPKALTTETQQSQKYYEELLVPFKSTRKKELKKKKKDKKIKDKKDKIVIEKKNKIELVEKSLSHSQNSVEDFTQIDKYLQEKRYTSQENRELRSLIINRLEKNLVFKFGPPPNVKEPGKGDKLKQSKDSTDKDDKFAVKVRQKELKPKKKRRRGGSGGISHNSPLESDPSPPFDNVIAFLDLHNMERGKRNIKKSGGKDLDDPHSCDSISPRLRIENFDYNTSLNSQPGVMKIRLPNSSHKSFPINESTSAGEISDKLRNKLTVEQPGHSWGECELFELKGKDEISLPSDCKLLPLFASGSEFIFKKRGEKEVNREEEIQRIIKVNLNKEKQKLMEGVSQSSSQIKRASESSFSSDRRNFHPSPDWSNDPVADALVKVQLLMQDLNGYKEKFDSLKKTRKIPVDTSDVLVMKMLSDKTNIKIYTALVSGWTVILKEYLHADSSPSQSLSQIYNEISLLDSLPYHPNIVKYLFHEKNSKRVRLYLTYYTCSLRELINNRRNNRQPFQIKEIKRIISEIIEGVIFLHSYCLVHRYLTPENIFCNMDEDSTKLHENISNVCIGGYDFAFQVGTNPKFNGPLSIYSAPESKLSEFGCGTDIYALGVILFELLTLSPPKDHNELALLAEKYQFNSSPSLRLSSSSQVIDIVLKCVNKTPAQRPSAFQLKNMVENIIDDSPSESALHASCDSSDLRFPRIAHSISG